MKLAARAWLSLIVLGGVIGLLLFGSAGTIDYWEAWAYLAVFLGASAFATQDLLARDPALLERRMRGGPAAEKEGAQRLIMSFASLGFVGLVVVPALDHRFGWSFVPAWLVIVGDLLVLVGFYLILLVYRANTYAAATIRVEAGQRVISSGPYAIVRHPMYSSAMAYLIGTPLALGSYWGFAALAAMLPSLIWRLLDEERLLARELAGYREYQSQVRYRLIPGVW